MKTEFLYDKKVLNFVEQSKKGAVDILETKIVGGVRLKYNGPNNYSLTELVTGKMIMQGKKKSVCSELQYRILKNEV